MYKVILKLDKFFLKYEGGGGGGLKLSPPQEKLPSKSLIRVKRLCSHLRQTHIKLLSDNSTAVCAINNMVVANHCYVIRK